MRNLTHMSMQIAGASDWRIPEFSVADRLRKARESAGMSQDELAEDIGVSRRSIVRYEGSGTPPKSVVLLYSMRTRVPAEWLMSGNTGGNNPVGPVGIEPTRSTV